MQKLNHKQTFWGAAIAIILGTSCCWLPFLAISLGGATSLLAFSGSIEKYSILLVPIGILLFVYGFWEWRRSKQLAINSDEVVLESTITCPECGFQRLELMPTDACQYFYECENCKKIIKAKAGDCCVFCSYGDVACPPMQNKDNCCN